MKNKLFYVIITAVTVLLCLPGCTETDATTGTDSNAEVSYEDKKFAVTDKEIFVHASTAATVTSTLTPLQTFERVTELTYEADEKTEKTKSEDITQIEADDALGETINEPGWFDSESENTEINNEWFKAHTMFTLRGAENNSRHGETWYRFPFDRNNETTESSVARSNKFNIDISGAENGG